MINLGVDLPRQIRSAGIPRRVSAMFRILFMLRILFAICVLFSWQVATAAGPPNVVLIMVDDLNDWVGCLGGHPQSLTPNIDKLAAKGVLFANAHCQAPLCNPSRSSLLNGLRPSTTGIHGLVPGIRSVEATKAVKTLPQAFTGSGYHTYTCGKVYHDGSVAKDKSEFAEWGPAPGPKRPEKPIAKLPEPRHPAMDWGEFGTEVEHCDYQIANAARMAIQRAPKDKPFFVATGFRSPHVPCFAPKRWFDAFPEASLILPEILEKDRDDVPPFAWKLHWRLPEPRLATLQKEGEWKSLVRAYLASIHFMDAQVGRVLQALDESGRAQDTIVVLLSDHGYHMGEKAITGKNTLWERSTRVPLIFAGPGIGRGVCLEPVELLDLFPTLLLLCELPSVAGLEGHSLKPQLKDPKQSRPWPAITTHNQGNHAIRSKTHRYIQYADGTEELYDMVVDPKEWQNLARDPQKAKLKTEMASWLPKPDVPAAKDSKHRILTYDKATGKTTWEGDPVGSQELPPR